MVPLNVYRVQAKSQLPVWTKVPQLDSKAMYAFSFSVPSELNEKNQQDPLIEHMLGKLKQQTQSTTIFETVDLVVSSVSLEYVLL
mmetsp:Transcript_7646/g.10539  ORF Transcript_7646/g.10539 Transcript_7646/m.10539 type:complete len:85 (+) Transcript_7646:562-816(+)